MAVCLCGRKSKLVMDRYSPKSVTIPSQNKNRKTKPNQRKNTQAKQAKTDSTKQTEKGKWPADQLAAQPLNAWTLSYYPRTTQKH